MVMNLHCLLEASMHFSDPVYLRQLVSLRTRKPEMVRLATGNASVPLSECHPFRDQNVTKEDAHNRGEKMDQVSLKTPQIS